MNDPLCIGVVGLNFGMNLVRTVARPSNARLVAIADRSSEQARLDSVASTYGCNAYRDAARMFELERLDAVLICTAPGSRETLMQAALEKNVAIWVEKPWASDFQQAKHLHQIASRSKRPVMCGFSFRFHPAVQKLTQLVRSELGRPWMLHAQYVFNWWPAADWWLWRPDGGNGFFNENSGHLLDVVCAVAGDPEHVHAETSRYGDSPGENAACVTVKFRSGAIASLALGGVGSRAAQDYPRLTAYTENGQADLIGEQHTWRELRWSLRNEQTLRSFIAPPESLANTRYTYALDHFLTCVRNNTPADATSRDGVRAVAIADAIRESARTGLRVPVQHLPTENP